MSTTLRVSAMLANGDNSIVSIVRTVMLIDSVAVCFTWLFQTGMLACSKSLFISDQDKRKHFRLQLRLFLEVGSVRQEGGSIKQEVGSFHSRLIKVISKPSQKRQTMKNADC